MTMASNSMHVFLRTWSFPLIFVVALLPLVAVIVWFYAMSFESIELVLEQQTGRLAHTTAAAATRVYGDLIDDTGMLTRGREIGRYYMALQDANRGVDRALEGSELKAFLDWWISQISADLYLQAIYLNRLGQPVYKHVFRGETEAAGLESINLVAGLEGMRFTASDGLGVPAEGNMLLSRIHNGSEFVFRIVRPLRPLRGQKESPGYVAVDFSRSSIVGERQDIDMDLLIRDQDNREILFLSNDADTTSAVGPHLAELMQALALPSDEEREGNDATKAEVVTISGNGEEYLASSVYLEEPFWTVTVFTPMNAYMASAKTTGNYTLAVTLCFMTFSIWFVAKLAQRIQERSRLLERTNADLEEANEVVSQHNELLEKELDTAHEMQMQLMPTDHPRIEGFDIAGICRPATHVGGDFFQYFPLPDGRLVLAMADVTGHGMEAAIPTVLFSGILDNQMENASSLDELFSRLNRSLCRTLNRRTFVCFAMGELDPISGRVRITNGGCPYPYHYRACTGAVEEVRLDAFPLGLRQEAEYAVAEVELAAGDHLVFCSDGIIEVEGEDGEIFGFDRTGVVIGQAAAENVAAAQVIERLLDAVDRFSGGAEQSDDQTIVVLSVEGDCDRVLTVG
jgi:serine phosphatase RsbU (regulator of sigma subunit)